MAWREAQAQLVTIIEGTTPPVSRFGASKFKHAKMAWSSGLALPSTRSFWLEPQDTDTRPLHRVGGAWRRISLDIVFAYRIAARQDDVTDSMLRDAEAITPRLLSPAQWGRPSSTLFLVGYDGTDSVLKTTFSETTAAEGTARFMRVRCRVEFDSTE